MGLSGLICGGGQSGLKGAASRANLGNSSRGYYVVVFIFACSATSTMYTLQRALRVWSADTHPEYLGRREGSSLSLGAGVPLQATCFCGPTPSPFSPLPSYNPRARSRGSGP